MTIDQFGVAEGKKLQALLKPSFMQHTSLLLISCLLRTKIRKLQKVF